ncbi:MAG: glycosyltransferase family 1 protein [bacterium]|nr:glycosyltransferase family 1 protein [bacterium]
MRIGIDARAYGWTGIGRYARNLLATVTTEARAATDAPLEFVVFVPARYARDVSELPHTTAIPVRDSYYSWYEQAGFLLRLLATKVDLIHFLNFNAPIGYRRPFVVTIHDLTRFHFPGERHRSRFHQWAYAKVFSSAVHGAERIIAVSQFTKEELIQKFPSVAPKVSVISEGVEERFFASPASSDNAVLRRLGIPTPYVLYVGLWMKHKNLPGLLEAFKAARAAGFAGSLVVTGDEGSGGEHVRHVPEAAELRDALILPGRVSDEDLPTLYRHARAFVFPSFSEGFGLPPLEAMASGTPVIAARASSLPEILGDAALYADPHSPKQIAAALLLLEADPHLRRQLQDRGRNRAAQFSWAQCGRETLALYRGLGVPQRTRATVFLPSSKERPPL